VPLYKNIKTGAVVDVPCEVKGDWKLVEKNVSAAKTKKEIEPKTVEKPKKAEAKKKTK